jgi:hypothetical protein
VAWVINPDRQKQQFADRLKRISAGGANTMSQVYVGAMDDPDIKRSRSGKPIAASAGLGKVIRLPFTILGALSMGMIAVVLARFIRAALADGELTGPDADIMMAVDAALGLAVGFALNMVFRMKGKVQETMRTLGVVAMVMVMHNFVHWAPVPFQMAFSTDWVAEVIETTKPNSVLFLGVSYEMGDKPGKQTAPVTAAKWPQISRLQ